MEKNMFYKMKSIFYHVFNDLPNNLGQSHQKFNECDNLNKESHKTKLRVPQGPCFILTGKVQCV